MLIGDESKNDSQWEGVLDLSWGVEPRPFFRVDRIDVNEGIFFFFFVDWAVFLLLLVGRAVGPWGVMTAPHSSSACVLPLPMASLPLDPPLARLFVCGLPLVNAYIALRFRFCGSSYTPTCRPMASIVSLVCDHGDHGAEPCSHRPNHRVVCQTNQQCTRIRVSCTSLTSSWMPSSTSMGSKLWTSTPSYLW